jgi:Kef-type K+ transport system membrane component KefB
MVTKVVGGYLGAVGFGAPGPAGGWSGMMPRGEVVLVVASLGLGLGVISRELFGVVLAMTVVTTLVTPPVLAPMIRRKKERRGKVRERRRSIEDAPGAGAEP